MHDKNYKYSVYTKYMNLTNVFALMYLTSYYCNFCSVTIEQQQFYFANSLFLRSSLSMHSTRFISLFELLRRVNELVNV